MINDTSKFWSRGPGGRRRLRLFVALDHGLSFPQMEGLERPFDIVRTVAENDDVDGLIASLGVYSQARKLGLGLSGKTRLAVVDYVDPAEKNGVSYLRQREMIVKPQEVDFVGAHCYKMFLNIYDDPRELYRNCRDMERFVTYGAQHGVSTLAEIMFYGNKAFGNPAEQAEELMKGCRLAMELGADVLKIPTIADLDAIDEIADRLRLPIYMMGGAKSSESSEFLDQLGGLIRRRIDGFMFGRNIWQDPNMNGVIGEICDAIQKCAI